MRTSGGALCLMASRRWTKSLLLGNFLFAWEDGHSEPAQRPTARHAGAPCETTALLRFRTTAGRGKTFDECVTFFAVVDHPSQKRSKAHNKAGSPQTERIAVRPQQTETREQHSRKDRCTGGGIMPSGNGGSPDSSGVMYCTSLR